MYEIMESQEFNSFEEFVIKKVFADNHYSDECFDKFRKLTIKELCILSDNGDYLADIFRNIIWFYFI